MTADDLCRKIQQAACGALTFTYIYILPQIRELGFTRIDPRQFGPSICGMQRDRVNYNRYLPLGCRSTLNRHWKLLSIGSCVIQATWLPRPLFTQELCAAVSPVESSDFQPLGLICPRKPYFDLNFLPLVSKYDNPGQVENYRCAGAPL
jgi:hypothetical protein